MEQAGPPSFRPNVQRGEDENYVLSFISGAVLWSLGLTLWLFASDALLRFPTRTFVGHNIPLRDERGID